MAKFIRVTKMDAAVRQLRTAIRLWFHDGDPVSIQTLLAAAHEIIHVLYRRMGLKDLLFDSALIKEEYRSTVAQGFRAIPNFFKHARADPEGEIEFDPLLNYHLIILLTGALRHMNHPQGMEEEAVLRWLLVHQPDFLILPEDREPVPIEELEQIKRMSKTEFFRSAELHWRG
jgi:hypothetical protein